MDRFPTTFARVAFLVALVSCGASKPAMAVDAVVVLPQAWSAAIQPWKAHRARQGYQIAEVDAALGRDAIRDAIRQLANRSQGRLRYVLLAGDVAGPDMPRVNVPTFYHASTAMVQFGGDPVIATDNDYGDLEGDATPELAVGRIPADTPEQLAELLNRIVDHELQSDFSAWRRRVHVVAGVGGFGPVADSVIDLTTRRFLSDRLPGWSELSMTQASLQSLYCPDPLQFSDTCIERLNEGGMFWVYIGHGHVHTLDYLRAGNAYLPIMTNDHIPAVNTGSRAPIAIFLACYTGAFDAPEDSLAERLLLSSTGPIAVVAASRVSGPYGMAMLSDGLLESCFEQRARTLGDVILLAKQNMLNDERFQKTADALAEPAVLDQAGMINAIADALSPTNYDLKSERLEHVWQMNLLGDPMLQLSHPADIEFEMSDEVAPGESLAVRGQVAAAGKLTLELALRRGNVHQDVRELQVGLESVEQRERYQQRYRSANHSLIAVCEADCEAGPFAVEIPIPASLPRGKYCVRLFQETHASWHVGYQEVRVRPAADRVTVPAIPAKTANLRR